MKTLDKRMETGRVWDNDEYDFRVENDKEMMGRGGVRWFMMSIIQL